MKTTGRRNTQFKKKTFKPIATARKVDVQQDKAIKKLEKKVNKIEGETEVKAITSYDTNLLESTVPLLFTGPLLENGSKDDERIGSKITLKKMDFVWQFYLAAGNYDATVRIIYLWDTGTNGNILDTCFIETGPDPILSTRNTCAILDTRKGEPITMALPHYETRDRYRFLYDKVITVKPYSQALNNMVNIRGTLNLHGAGIDYAGSTAGTFELVKRSMRIILCLTDAESIVYRHVERYQFTDL